MKKRFLAGLAAVLLAAGAGSSFAQETAEPALEDQKQPEQEAAQTASTPETAAPEAAPQAAPVQAAAPDTVFKVSGEVKTGLYWEYVKEDGKDAAEDSLIRNNDDAGGNEGRFRLDMQLDHKNIGMKVRFENTVWVDPAPKWAYAFAYGNFIDNQLKISAGRLGDSPWGSGGPELWKELDTNIGIRTEIKPHAIPGLNVGFVLNKWNGGEVTGSRTLIEVLKESVLGLSYYNDYFGVRGAYRLDSDLDANDEEAVWRVEEKVLGRALPGFQIFANGYINWINASEGGRGGSDPQTDTTNWLYLQYEPKAFTAQLRLGLETTDPTGGDARQIMTVRPTYYHNLFNKLLQVGASFTYAQDFGPGRFYEDALYTYLEFQPKVQINFDGAYVALVYDFKNEYCEVKKDTMRATHWLNLRVVYTF